MSKIFFLIEEHTTIDKSFEIEGPGLAISVDYDDVDHVETEALSKYMVEILNTHWDENEAKRRITRESIKQNL